jgi:glycosyltransferase involved in cell wall biosynthesis
MRSQLRVCVIRQMYFDNDPLLRREVGALVADGAEVDVLCMKRGGQPGFERAGAVTVRRLPLSHSRGGIPRYFFEYALFLILATAYVTFLHLRRRYDLVQVNTPPDSLVFAALVPKLMGTPVLIHLAEPMPEFFASKFKTSLKHPGVIVLGWIERVCIRFADRAITCTQQMREAFVRRGSDACRIDVILNAADETVFDPTRFPPEPPKSGDFVLISHGTMEERYGLDTTIDAVALLRDEIPGLRLRLFGGGTFRSALERLAAVRGVADRVEFSQGWAPMDELVQAIASADAGVVAMKRDAFRDVTHCNKMFDFVSMRKPALVSRTAAVEAYFGDDCFEMFEPNDAADLARAIRNLYRDRERAQALAERAARRNEPYRWPRQRERYLAVVRELMQGRAGIPRREEAGGRK